MEMHWNVLVSISTKWTLVIYSRRKISLGLWYIGVSGYMASALKTSSVEGQSNLPLVFAVLSKLMISGSDTGSICSLTEILSSAQPSSRVSEIRWLHLFVGVTLVVLILLRVGSGVGVCTASFLCSTFLLPAVGVCKAHLHCSVVKQRGGQRRLQNLPEKLGVYSSN